MEEIYCKNLTELKKEKKFIERELKVKISNKGRLLEISGDPINEYEASLVIEAINLGFSARSACLLKDEDYVLEIINIKDYTRRKDLDIVRGRLIGTHGKTKKTIEEISHCKIKIKDNAVGIIGPAENIQHAITAITNVIKGTKQTNVYKYLERINTTKKQTKN